jgi:vancomycin permeability regulator SanA
MLPTDFGQNAQVNGSYTDALTGATEAYKQASMENLITTYNTGKNAYNAKKTPSNTNNLLGESVIPVGATIKQVK